MPSGTKNAPMQRAIREARAGIRRGHGGPFGACVVRNGKIIAAAHNTVLLDSDPTAHAEINAIRKACRKLRARDLDGCELFATAEPCPMCLGAILWARIRKLHFGVARGVAKRYGFDDEDFYAELRRPRARLRLPTREGVLARDCEALFAEWKGNAGVLY